MTSSLSRFLLLAPVLLVVLLLANAAPAHAQSYQYGPERFMGTSGCRDGFSFLQGKNTSYPTCSAATVGTQERWAVYQSGGYCYSQYGSSGADFARYESDCRLVNQNPTGSLDVASCEYASGWAYDPDAPNSPIDVHFYIAGNYAGQMSAGEYRGDLPGAGIGNGYHAFNWPIPGQFKNGSAYTVDAYAINTPAGDNVYIGSRQFQCAAAQPDLVGYVGGAVTATVNQAVTLYGTVANTGSGTAGATTGMIEVCDANCATIHEYGSAYVGALGSGSSQQVSVNYAPPRAVQLYYRTCADWYGGVAESNEGNNCSGWQLLNVQEPTPAIAPDVYMDANPTTIQSGQSSTLTWYWMEGSQIVNYDQMECNINGIGRVQTRGSLVVYPTQTTTYRMTCDYPSYDPRRDSRGRTAKYANASVTVIQPQPPQAPTGLTAQCNASGTSFSFSWNASSGATFYQPRVHPAASGECSSYGWQVWSGDGQTCLPPGDAHYSTSVPNFPAVPGKTYSVWVHASNSAGASAPTSISVTCAAPPDLTPGSAPTVTTTLGSAVTVSGTASNIGGASPSGFSTIFVTNLNAQGTAWNTVIAASPESPALGQNGSSSFSATFGANTFSSSGTYYYGYCVDFNTSWTGRVSESNEGNNCVTGSIVVQAPAQPDLIASVGNAASTVVNQAVTLYGAVANSGNALASASTAVIQICDSGCSTLNTTRDASVAALGQGGSQNVSASYTPGATGQLYYRTCADWYGGVAESNEGNNCSGWQSLVVNPPANQVPTGNLDAATCAAGGVGGWAYDPDVPNSAINVHFYIGGNYAGQVSANQYRGDLAGYGNGQHGFTWSIPSQYINGSAYNITAYAIDSAGGTNPAIGTRSFQCAAPQPDLIASVGNAASTVVNQAVTLYGAVANSGNALASASTAVIQICDSGCSTLNTTRDASVAALGQGGSQNVSASYTPGATGQLYYRTCADWYGGVAESNEGNNCSGWQTLTVDPAPQPPAAPTNPIASCSADGTSVTLSWTAPASATSYFVRMDDNTNNTPSCADGWYCANPPDRVSDYHAGTSITYSGIVPGRSYHWWVHAGNANGIGSQVNAGFSCAGLPDLTASPGPAASGTQGSALTLSGTVQNLGSGSAGSFPSFIQVCNDGNCASVNERISTGYMSSLASGAAQAVSASYTPSVSGQLYYRTCSNFNTSWVNIITESNYGNNCSTWQSLVIAAPTPPSLSCSVSPSAIEPGQSVTYSANPANGATGPYTWTASDGGSFGTGSSVTRTLTTPGTYAMDVRSANAAVSYCPNVAVEASWCTTAATNLTITATPNRVRAGQTTTLSWNATGVNGQNATCTVSGPGVSWSAAVSANPSCSAASSANPTITTQSTYTLTCGGQSESVTVNVIPSFREF